MSKSSALSVSVLLISEIFELLFGSVTITVPLTTIYPSL